MSFGLAEGGIAECINNVARVLAQRHEVTVYGINPKGLPRTQKIDGVIVERFKHFAPSGAYYFSVELPLKLLRSRFDVVHGHGYHSFPLHFCTLAKCRKFVAQTHFHGHGHTPFRDSLLKLLKPFGRRTLRKADKIIAVSEFEKSLLQKTFKLNPSKIVVIPNGVNLKEFSGLKRRKRGFRSILYVGTLRSYKGPQYLVEVLPRLDEDVILEIVGNGPLRERLELRAKKLNVSERVRFFHDLPRRELLQKYADADVFVLLSRYEAYSLVIAEALNFPRPKYAHIPLLLNPDRTKLSKRKQSITLRDYKEKGYLPEALLNFLVLLGWHPEEEEEFLSRCIRCGECIRVCSTSGGCLQPGITGMGIAGLMTPRADYHLGYCEYECNLCGQICPTEAIQKLKLKEKKRYKMGTAIIQKDRCIPYRLNDNCIVCEEHCPIPEKAIKLDEKKIFSSFYNSEIIVKYPYAIPELCIGCGICENKCPVEGEPGIIVIKEGEERIKI